MLAGLALGVVASLALIRMFTALLYGITATDPGTYLAVSGLLVTMALLTGYIPARRATKVDPMVTLRYE